MPDPHEIVPEPVAPPLPGTAIVRPTRDDAIDALCADLYLQAQGCVQAFGDFHLAVDPADAATAVIVRVMVDPLYRELPRADTHVWPTTEARTRRTTSGKVPLHLQLLGDRAGIPPGQVHPIPLGQGRADEVYEARCAGAGSALTRARPPGLCACSRSMRRARWGCRRARWRGPRGSRAGAMW
ncbi:MAG: hypothetical protein R3B49_09615 [Phycisphaerales bacterium]